MWQHYFTVKLVPYHELIRSTKFQVISCNNFRRITNFWLTQNAVAAKWRLRSSRLEVKRNEIFPQRNGKLKNCIRLSFIFQEFFQIKQLYFCFISTAKSLATRNLYFNEKLSIQGSLYSLLNRFRCTLDTLKIMIKLFLNDLTVLPTYWLNLSSN